MRMPWGKHRGTPVHELEDSYIWWLFGQDIRDFNLSQEIERIAQDRWPYKFIRNVVVVKQEPPTNDTGIMADVKSIYRKLALKFHPDHGGNTLAMAALNEFKELLSESNGR